MADHETLETQIQRLSSQSMILTMAIRRGIIPAEKLAELEAETARHFTNHPRGVADAWKEFEAEEKSREKPRNS